jgi:membrane protease YdiL (CAAX protease family)
LNKVKTLGIALLYLVIYVIIFIFTNFLLNLLSTGEFRAFLIEHPASQLVAVNLVALVIYYLIFKLRGMDLFEETRFRRMNSGSILTILPIGLGLGMLIYTFSALPYVSENLPGIVQLTEMVGNGGNVLILLLGSIFLASLMEEILFRGILLQTLKKQFSVIAAVCIQALLFGAILMDVALGLYAALGAIIFGLVFIWGRSLWASLITHMVSTSTIVLMFQLNTYSQISHLMEQVLLVSSVIMLFSGLWMLNRQTKRGSYAETEFIGS